MGALCPRYVRDPDGPTQDDLEAQAVELMREWGPVHVGSPAGDFNVIALPDRLGWVVTCHHNDILTYVSSEEMEGEPEDVVVGLYGRSKRHQDSHDLQVIHVEDNRHHETFEWSSHRSRSATVPCCQR